MLPLAETRPSQNVVSVRPFQTGHMHCRQNAIVDGLSGEAHLASWRFLVFHEASDTKLWFDLGMSTASTPRFKASPYHEFLTLIISKKRTLPTTHRRSNGFIKKCSMRRQR